MNSKFTLSQGAGQKLEFAVQRSGGSAEDVEYLSTGANFRAVTLLRTGKAKLVEVSDLGFQGSVIPTDPTPVVWTFDNEGNIHFTVTSNGMTCEQWESHLESRGRHLCEEARDVLRRASEAPTNGVPYHIVVVQADRLVSARYPLTRDICAAAGQRGWIEPHWEVACLIRDAFTDKQFEQMGLWNIITMHEPIKSSKGYPRVFVSSRHNTDSGWLGTECPGTHKSGTTWSRSTKFAFVVPARASWLSKLCRLAPWR